MPLGCRSFLAKEPLIIGLFCGKWPIKIRHPMDLGHCVAECMIDAYFGVMCWWYMCWCNFHTYVMNMLMWHVSSTSRQHMNMLMWHVSSTSRQYLRPAECMGDAYVDGTCVDELCVDATFIHMSWTCWCDMSHQHLITICVYGVALVSRIDRITGLFCKRAR